MLGNIRFICELGKMGILHEAVLHSCVQQLLAKKKQHQERDLAEDVECACQIMRTCGRLLDTERARPLMDQYFRRMQQLEEQPDLPNRIRFLLQNVAELRADGWQARAVNRPEGPRTITSIRQEARAAGVLPPQRAGPPSRAFPALPNMAPAAGVGRGGSGMDDVFGSLPVGFSTLGTGPGVIGIDARAAGGGGYGGPPGGGARGGGGGRGAPGVRQYQNKPGFAGPPGPGFKPNNTGPGQNYNNGGAKELAPRFKRMMAGGGVGAEELALRPAAMVLKPQAPSMLKGPPPSTAKPISMTKNEAPPILKQASHDKPRAKARAASREEALSAAMAVLVQLWSGGGGGGGHLETAVAGWRDAKVQDKFAAHVVHQMLSRGLNRTVEERALTIELLAALVKAGALTGGAISEAVRHLVDEMEDTDDGIQVVAGYLSGAVHAGLLELAEVASECESGAHFPLGFVVLQRLTELTDPDTVSAMFNKAKLSLVQQLPIADRTKERLAEVLQQHQLAFLSPLLQLPSQLVRQLAADPSETGFYKWIRANVPAHLHHEKDFVGALFLSVIRFVTEQTSLAPEVDRSQAPDKPVQERERELLQRFRQVLQAFTHDHIPLQVAATYALQVYCYQHQFPKGMLLRWFNLLYDLEVVEEEAFMRWKEDISDEFPGKGKALFQVNQWLTWLEQAESDDEEEEE